MSTSAHAEPPTVSSERRRRLAWGFGFVRPYLAPLVGIALLGLLASASGLVSPLVVMALWDDLLEWRDSARLPWLLAALALLAVVGFVLGVVTALFFTRISARILIRMRLAMLRQVLAQPLALFTHQPVGDLHARLANDVADLQSFVVDVPIAALRHIVILLGSVLLMAYLSVPLLLLALVPIVPAALAVATFRERVTLASRAVRDANGEISSVLVESLTGIGFLKAFALESRQARRFLGESRTLLEAVVKLQVLAAFAGGVPELLVRIGSLAVLGAGAWMLDAGRLGAGTLIAIGLYQMGLFRPVAALLGLVVRFHQAEASMARVFEVIAHTPPAPPATGRSAPRAVRGELVLEEVSYRYAGAPMPALDRVSLRIPAGSSCAIIGATGAGKSTLVGLLTCTLAPESGRVLVDGVDLATLRRNSYLRSVGVVTQDTFLLHASLEENLRAVRPRATSADLARALEIADLETLVKRLPEGLATRVGERGTRLSGGERQRVAIARAVLRDPRILILDEATSALDLDTDRRVRDAIAQLMHDRTVVVITHRVLSAIELDQVAVLAQGRVLETGAPAVLAQNANGVYSGLIARAGSTAARDPELPGAGITVAIVDSGINAGHPHVGRVAGGVSFTGASGDDPLVDRIGHGTPVAAVVRWLAPGAELVSLKVFDRDLAASATRVAAALRHAIAARVDVVCLALGTQDTAHDLAELQDACRAALAAGVTIVAAGRGDAPSYPASWPDVLGVLRDDRLGDDELGYRPGAAIPFVAAGRPRPIPGVPAALNLRGVSFAAPRLAARVAVLKATHPGLDDAELRRRLIATTVSPGEQRA